MPAPIQGRPSAPATAALRNQRETAVVDWLIDRLATRLADRSGQRHPPPWEPRQSVLLGVLEPIRVQPPLAVSDDGAISEESGAEAGSAEPAQSGETVTKPGGEVPSIGLDFRVAVDDGAAIELTVDVDFAIYLEEIATLQEQRSYLGATDAVPDAAGNPSTASDPRPDDAQPGPTGTVSSEAQKSAMTCVAEPEQPITADLKLASSPMKQQARKTRLLGAWQRYDASVVTMQIPVPSDGTVINIDEPLTAAVRSLIEAHYERPRAMRPFTAKRNEISRDALKDESAFQAEVSAALDCDWRPAVPKLALSAFAQPLGNAQWLVSVTLRNHTLLTGRTLQDLSAYDCRLRVHPSGQVRVVPQRFDLAPDDYRLQDEADVIGRGNACVAVPTENGGIRSETLPVHVQSVVVSRADHVKAPAWPELADDPTEILRSVQEAMAEFEAEFRNFVDCADGEPHYAEASRELAQFSDELRRFTLGRRAMKADARLALAFQLANEVFARANKGKPFQTWRLFQLVYIVSHLPSLAAREHDDAEFREELKYVDVLWFPAGGGKTEAYLGLIITALFYDRLRGKDAGVTSWLRFPLRMLSVQQLSRMLRMLVLAEDLRQERQIGAAEADPFALGYLVGSAGTPNSLKWPRSWWRGWDTEISLAAKGEFVGEHLDHRLVTACPRCGQDKVILDIDEPAVRLVHRCTACSRDLPLFMTDEEVYRYLPAVVISTVDKLTGYTWFPEYTAFSHGPRYICPDHGYFSFPLQGTCLVGRDLCPPPTMGHPTAPGVKDPVPALTVQDEMHLLKEELGAFTGHYEGLIAELQEGGPSGLPTKILAASATIEQYQDQLRQVYGRRPRAFPAPGYERDRSFYTQKTPDVRRAFVGVLPHYRRKADVAAIVQTELLEAVTELQDAPDPLAVLGMPQSLWGEPPSRDDALRLLFDYEVSLGYVNSKAHGAKLDEELRLLSDKLDDQGRGAVDLVVLTGQVPIPELAQAIGRVQGEQPSLARELRLRALVGTSVVSHGVDLDRLNVLVMAGMPTTAADYIQVTARSGRTHAGLVVTVYDSFSRRERSLFSNFASYHRFLDQMVTPVPVNKYAFFVADRTVPGIALALLHDLARDQGLGAPEQGIRRSKDFQAWWNQRRQAIDARVQQRLRRCYETPITGVNDPDQERELGDRALARWNDTESKALSRPPEEKNTESMFYERPLANFRDIDDPADFSVYYRSREAFEAVTGQRAPLPGDPNGGGEE